MFLYKYLFSKNDQLFFDRDIGWEEYSKEIEEKRALALEEVYNYGGIDAIFEFAYSVEDRYKVGFSLRTLNDKIIQNIILPKYLDLNDEASKQLVAGYIAGQYSSDVDKWIDSIDFSSWNNDQICSLLINIGYSEIIWYKAQDLLGNDVSIFWERIDFSPHAMYGNLTVAIDNLIKYGRPIFAAEVIYINYRRNKILLIDKAIEALVSGIESKEDINKRDRYSLIEIIKHLQKDNTIDQRKLFQIEWAYFGLFDKFSGDEPITLEKCLSSDPSFLLEILRLLYKSEKEEKNSSSINGNTQAAANNAWKLLEEWELIPGFTENNEFSEELLIEWFNSVKKICSDEGYLDIAMYNIGKVFYYAPRDPSGLWINKKVAEILDKKENVELREGYNIKAINSRGAHIVNATGEDERQLAELWRIRSQELEKAEFVYFATSVKELATRYDHDAKRVVSQFRSITDDKEEIKDE